MPSRTRRLSFEIGSPSAGYAFQTINRVCGIEVGFYSDFGGKERRSLVELCRRKSLFTSTVRSTLDWCRKLGVETKHLYIQFVWSSSLGLRVTNGKAITGKRGRAVLLLEADIVDGELLGRSLVLEDHLAPNDIGPNRLGSLPALLGEEVGPPPLRGAPDM